MWWNVYQHTWRVVIIVPSHHICCHRAPSMMGAPHSHQHKHRHPGRNNIAVRGGGGHGSMAAHTYIRILPPKQRACFMESTRSVFRSTTRICPPRSCIIFEFEHIVQVGEYIFIVTLICWTVAMFVVVVVTAAYVCIQCAALVRSWFLIARRSSALRRRRHQLPCIYLVLAGRARHSDCSLGQPRMTRRDRRAPTKHRQTHSYIYILYTGCPITRRDIPWAEIVEVDYRF